jgi:cytochrome c oxidase cbb3-type subunit 2
MLNRHHYLERNAFWLLVCSIIAISIGGIIEIIPLFRMETTIHNIDGIRPLTPLELAGQAIYIREHCSACHSQQIRPLRDEVERYGHYSLAAESMYDHPFLWGSKRTGPDLARVGGKYSDQWHVEHLANPRAVVPESIMPAYGFLLNKEVNSKATIERMRALKIVGVPYNADMIRNAEKDLRLQARSDQDSSAFEIRYGKNVLSRDIDNQPELVSEMDALVAYLQILGTFVSFAPIHPDANKMETP